MKLRSALFALAALLCGPALAAGSGYSIFFNDFTESNSSCHIDNVTGVQTSIIGSANLVAVTNPPTPLAFVNCGTGSGTAPALSLAISPTSVNAGATPPANQATLTWSANNVTSCTVTGTDASVATEFPNQWLNAGVVCGGVANKCAGSANTVTLTPIANGANAAYNFGLQCTDGTTTVSTTKALTVTGSTATGGTPSASFTFSVNGLTASFTDTSTNNGGTNGAWAWDFGDSTTSNQKNPTHTYATNGTYTVTLTVTDSVSSAQSSTQKSVTVNNALVTACTNGQTGDISGYTALCYGSAKLYSGGSQTLGPSNFTFSFAFGTPWPGSYFGYTTQWTLANNQFLSIPFVASPGHTVVFSTNSTYTPNNGSAYSISTSPGLFNNGAANGSTVLCVGKNNPSLSVTSNNSTGANCHINATSVYWLNMVPGSFGPSGSIVSCSKTPCNIAVSAQLTN